VVQFALALLVLCFLTFAMGAILFGVVVGNVPVLMASTSERPGMPLLTEIPVVNLYHNEESGFLTFDRILVFLGVNLLHDTSRYLVKHAVSGL
jgi:hypothetical protein